MQAGGRGFESLQLHTMMRYFSQRLIGTAGLLACCVLGFAGSSVASGPATAIQLDDPSQASLAEYGAISQPGQVVYYRITPSSTVTAPVELLVPARYSNRWFTPSVAVLGADIPGSQSLTLPGVTLPPSGNQGVLLNPSSRSSTDTLSEPFSVEKLYRGTSTEVTFSAGQTYYLAVFDAEYYAGDFVLAVGTVENFGKAPVATLAARAIQLKFGLSPGREIPWADLTGLLMVSLAAAAGFGSLLLAGVWQHYRSPSTAPTPIVKPLLVVQWTAVAGFLIGSTILFHRSGSSGVATFQELGVVVMVIILAVAWFRLLPRQQQAVGGRGMGWAMAAVALIWVMIITLLVWYVLVSR